MFELADLTNFGNTASCQTVVSLTTKCACQVEVPVQRLRLAILQR